MLDSLVENLPLPTVSLTVIIVTIVATAGYFRNAWRSPGPWGIPILGYYPFLREDYPAQMMEMAKKYGDVYLISIGGKRYLHLSSHKALREVFITKSECFTGRDLDFSMWEHLAGDGILFAENDAWRVLRKFVGQGMRELGIGPKEQLKGPILQSVEATLKTLRESQGKPVDITTLLTTHCVEVVRRLILGDNVSSQTAMKLSQAYLSSLTIMSNIGDLLCGNFARRFLFPRCKGYKELLEAKEKMHSMLYEILEAHKKNFDPEDPQDLIDLYLREKLSRQQKNDPLVKYFTDKALVSTLTLVYGDGSLTIAAFIALYLKILASRPDVQDAIYEEIVSQVGTERLPTYEDKTKFPYTSSVMKEMDRTAGFPTVISSLVSNSATSISGVYVPKGTITLINFNAVHGNPEVYPNPECFDPKRFMPEAENSKIEMPVAFGIGKRACAGEPLVVAEMFMFLTAILQQFTIQEEKKPEDDKIHADAIEQLHWKLLAYPRKHNC